MSPRIPVLSLILTAAFVLPAAAAENAADTADGLRIIAENIRASDGEIKVSARDSQGKWLEKQLTQEEALQLVYRQLATLEYEQALASGELPDDKQARVSSSVKVMGEMAAAVFKDAQAVSVKGDALEKSGRYCAWGYCVNYGDRFRVRTPTAVAAVRGGRKLDGALHEDLNRLGKGAETAARGIDKADIYLEMAASVLDDARAVAVKGGDLEQSGRYCAWGHCIDFDRRFRVRTPTAVAGVRGGRTLDAGAKLDPAEIYKQAAPSVVVVLCRGEGGGELGTGSIVDPEGRILTNAHVVIPDATGKPYETIRIYFKPAELTGDPKKDLSAPAMARVVKADRALDLALLELVQPRPAAAVMPIADTADVQPGAAVVTIGHPEQGGLWTLTSGVVSTLVADLGGVKGKDAFQTDASINRGNSGGPLIDLQGRMIGVNTSMARRAADGLAITSVNFAVRSSVVSKWLAEAKPGITGTLSLSQPQEVKRGLSVKEGKPELLTPAKPYRRSEVIDSMRESMAESRERMHREMDEMRRRQKEEMRSFNKDK